MVINTCQMCRPTPLYNTRCSNYDTKQLHNVRSVGLFIEVLAWQMIPILLGSLPLIYFICSDQMNLDYYIFIRFIQHESLFVWWRKFTLNSFPFLLPVLATFFCEHAPQWIHFSKWFTRTVEQSDFSTYGPNASLSWESGITFEFKHSWLEEKAK